MKIKELLADPSAWTQGTEARNRDGKSVFGESPRACCWCLVGAVMRCYPEGWQIDILRVLRFSVGGSVTQWNDAPGRTHAEVLALVEELDL